MYIFDINFICHVALLDNGDDQHDQDNDSDSLVAGAVSNDVTGNGGKNADQGTDDANDGNDIDASNGDEHTDGEENDTDVDDIEPGECIYDAKLLHIC